LLGFGVGVRRVCCVLLDVPGTLSLIHFCFGSRHIGGPCNFTSEVYLPSTLACDGDECDIDTVAVVDIRDNTTNKTVYYEYAPLASFAFSLMPSVWN
jgi:hypothetical protein